MTGRRNQARGANEWADTYGTIGAAAPMQLTQLPLHILDPWKDDTGKPQPFKPYSQGKLEELAENIRKNGVIEAICVRPMPSGRFQIIAGHNRVAASRMAGLNVIPAIVMQLNDDEAAIRMVDSNLQHREKLLPSEKAFAYLERMKSLKKLRGTDSSGAPMVHHPETVTTGAPVVHPPETDATGAPVVHHPLKGKSRDIIAEGIGENREQIRRYIRLTELLPELLDLVDNEKFSLRAAVEVSYLDKAAQMLLFQVMVDVKCNAPSMTQAAQLRKVYQAATLDAVTILSILRPTKASKATTVKLPAERITSFFPQNTKPEDMEAEICEALAFYRRHKTPASA